ncbi:MAG: hypothetical protein ACI9NQ_000949 [Paracoccaceae bacterium]
MGEGKTGADDEVEFGGGSSGAGFEDAKGAFFEVSAILDREKFHLGFAENTGEKKIDLGRACEQVEEVHFGRGSGEKGDSGSRWEDQLVPDFL